MYYPLYAANKWVEPLDAYLKDAAITDGAWFDYNDVLEGWRTACSIDGKPYGIPFDGEATIQVYRKDVYDKAGIKPAETFDEFVANAGKVHDPGNRLWGAALRGFRGAGQNMYIYPSIFRAFGGEWFDANKKLTVATEPAIKALEWYANLLRRHAPSGVENWNWPDIADAFGQGTVGVYIDAHSSAGVINDPQKSKVIGKIAYARWPKGPAGKRVTSIWNWGFPINAALPERRKKATWLFIQWATAKETQIATSYGFAGAYKRTGANRTSLWQDPQYRKLMESFGDNLVEATTASLREDIDVEWRPRIPQWPAVGEIMATAVQAALVGQASPKDALAEAQRKIDPVMRG
jgi:multiple sugar transport system substrate-binding protein